MTYAEILNTSKKRIDSIVEARKQRIVDESKQLENEKQAFERQSIKNQILAK